MQNLNINKFVLACAGIACLLFVFCFRLWNLGITHTDDASWFLASQGGNWGIIGDWAIGQGRIWPFISGTLIYITLYLQDTSLGQFLRVGSFSTFFVLFYFVLARYLGKQFALLAAALNLALYAMRWEGSIVSTYPPFTWVLGSLFLLAILLNIEYLRRKKSFYLYAAAGTFFTSLFLTEGVSVLFSALMLIAIFANQNILQKSDARFSFYIPVDLYVRRQLFWSLASIGLYFGIYFAWRLIFGSSYEGTKLGDITPLRILPPLFDMSTSGTILSDIVRPYVVNFSDAVGQDGYSVKYAPFSYLTSVTEGPSAFLYAIIVFTIVCLALSMVDRSTLAGKGRVSLHGSTIGLLITFLPILPVTLVGQYQQWYFDLKIHSYLDTALSHFGVTLVIASILIWAGSFTFAKTKLHKLFTILVAFTVAILGYCGYQMNEAIANDIRLETSRWKAVDMALGMAEEFGKPVKVIYTPRLFSGTWFTTLDAGYWEKYVLVTHKKSVQFTKESISAALVENNLAYFDFTAGRNPSQLIAVIAPISKGAENAMVANKIVVGIERPDPSDLAQYVLSFRDQSRGFVEVRYSQMMPIQGGGQARMISNISAYPESIQVSRHSINKAMPNSCDKSINSGATILFGTTSPGNEISCIAKDWLQEGWNPVEQLGAWTKDKSAKIVIPTSGLPKGNLTLTLLIGTYTGIGFSELPQTIKVLHSGNELAVRTDKKGVGFQSLKIKIPSSQWTSGKNLELFIEVDPIINPAKEKISSDSRNLGAYIKSLRLDVVKD